MQNVITFISTHEFAIVSGLLILSEGLALIPAVKANSVFQLIAGFLSKEKAALEPKA